MNEKVFRRNVVVLSAKFYAPASAGCLREGVPLERCGLFGAGVTMHELTSASPPACTESCNYFPELSQIIGNKICGGCETEGSTATGTGGLRPIGPAGGTITDVEIPVHGAEPGHRVVDVNVYIRIDHSRSSDLSVSLMSPDGTSITLASTLCGDENDWDVTFNDEASVSVVDACDPPSAPVLSGSLRPQESLTAFDGETPNGSWNLTIVDGQNGMGGSLRNAFITVQARGP